LGKLVTKVVTLLSNSKFPVIEDGRKSAIRGKLVLRKGDNPDRG
jgi:hypothetical protein